MTRKYQTDQFLIDQLMMDDTGAFEELFERYWYSLYSYAFSKLGNHEDAHQIVKKIFVDLWEGRGSIPLDFSINKHFYSVVRKELLTCVACKAAEEEAVSAELVGNVLPAFSTERLMEARVPVMMKQEPHEAPVALTAMEDEEEDYLESLGQRAVAYVKNVFQFSYLRKAVQTMMNL